MNKNYSTYLENLKGRRYDEELHGPYLSDGFQKTKYPDPVKYALEAMQEIDPSYSYKLFSSFRGTQNLITQKLRAKGLVVDVRYQGSHNTGAHIDLFGGLELIVLLKKYKKPSQDVATLAREIINILNESQAYNKVDYSKRHHIHIKTRKPVTTVTIIPAIWVETNLYKKSHLEINMGICEYNFAEKKRKSYLPFLNMARLNRKDKMTGGTLKGLIRLLQSIIADSQRRINISFDEVVGMAYNIKASELKLAPENQLVALVKFSEQLTRLTKSSEYSRSLLSPGRREYVFGQELRHNDLKPLKTEVDQLIEDINESLRPDGKTIEDSLPYN